MFGNPLETQNQVHGIGLILLHFLVMRCRLKPESDHFTSSLRPFVHVSRAGNPFVIGNGGKCRLLLNTNSHYNCKTKVMFFLSSFI